MRTVYEVAYSEAALDALSGIPLKQREQIRRKAETLAVNPFPPKSKQLKVVTDKEGNPVQRERSGDYRILYVVKDNPKEVIILDIGDRKDVYR